MRLTVALLLIVAGLGWAYAEEASRRSMFPLDREFSLLSLNGQPITGKLPTLRITTDGTSFTASGSAGCNSWSGGVELGGQDQFKLGRLRTTRMMCDRDIMRTEREFMAALDEVTRWQLDGEHLVLEGASGRLVFSRAPG